MAQISLSLLALFLIIFCLTIKVESTTTPTLTAAAARRYSRARAYLEAQCKDTRYPKLCLEGLSVFSHTTSTQGPQELAQISLSIALTKARYTKAYVSGVAKRLKSTKDKDYQIVCDCLNQVNDGVDQITQSILELRRIGRDDEKQFIWHQNNIQSWMSAALTDTTTCMDGFSGRVVGGKVKATIKAKILNVSQLASNALCLFNRFASRHRASRALKNP